MSLKAIHLLFIALSILLTLGFGVWCLWVDAGQRSAVRITFGIVSLAATVGLVVYGRWFLRKMKSGGFR